MPTVETTTFIKAPLDIVYAIAKDNHSFPLFMDDVKSVTVTGVDGNRVTSDWVGIISKFNVKVRWTQEDVWDDGNHVCTFTQVKGDYDEMSGKWEFTQTGEITRFHSVLDYEYNVPMLGPLVKKVVHSLVIKNMEGVLQAIKERAEQQANA